MNDFQKELIKKIKKYLIILLEYSDEISSPLSLGDFGELWEVFANLSASQEKEEDDLHYKKATIRIREDGRTEIRFRRDGFDKSFYGATQKVAKEKFNAWYFENIKNKKKQKQLTTKTKTVEIWFNEWLTAYKEPHLARKTFTSMRSSMIKYVISKIGSRTLSSLTPKDIQEVLNGAKHNGVPQNKIYTYFKDMLETARINKLIKENLFDGVKFVRRRDKNSVALTKQERADLIQAIRGNKLEQFYLFLLYSGCRRGEALKFKLEDIEGDRIHIKGTKTAKSDRYIPFFEQLKAIIKTDSMAKDQFYFEFANHVPTRHFKQYCPNHTLRDLRKTFATMCHERGISPKVVQKWLGHTNLSMTMNVYTEVTLDFENEELLKLNFDPKNDPKK